MLKKIGIEQLQEGDFPLVEELLAIMQDQEADFTLTFRYLADHTSAGTKLLTKLEKLFNASQPLSHWLEKWQKRLATEGAPEKISAQMNATNPLFIPRNHRISKAIRNAEEDGDFAEVDTLLKVLQTPFIEQPDFAKYANAPSVEERVTRTFCGT